MIEQTKKVTSSNFLLLALAALYRLTNQSVASLSCLFRAEADILRNLTAEFWSSLNKFTSIEESQGVRRGYNTI